VRNLFFLLLIIPLTSCNKGELNWLILSPNNIEGLTNLKFLLSGLTTTIFISLVSIIISIFVGLIVALSWSFYNLVRKKIDVDTDIGLLVESLFIFPAVIFAFYLIVQNDLNDFDISNVKLMLIFMLAGPMTVIPLYLYVRGVELCGLGPTGMVFYITPTLQFLLGYFLYNEELDIHKLISFILIWIAVSIYLKDLYEKN